ncbi:MAG: hypothetical protein N2560_04315 [Ignavibacteria bacterium]|nr:hypothetical protein [Ignavibacteria bacterium]
MMEGLRPDGIAFMVVAYSVIISLVVFCFAKVLNKNREQSE